MPLFGAHVSIAGGLHKAAETAAALDCGTMQIFSKNASQWAGKPLTDDEVAAFKAAVRKARLKYPTAHDSYLINLAAPGDELFEKSIAAFVDELNRAERLGLSYLVTHPGAHVGSGEDAGLRRVTEGLDRALKRTAGYKVKVLLENTAGMGTTLGHRFEHLARLIADSRDPGRLAVCFDTCHAFAAGYDLSTDAGYDATFAEFARTVGLRRLKLFHVNDSVKPLGSRVDRHAGIGLGQIGDRAFRRLATDPRFARLPMVLETPKEDADGNPMDPLNLARLRAFATEAPSPRSTARGGRV
ncbi:MAG TPA: deoxyribonuclease IV [Fimbriiglobus sp.]|nr:deoxyribonuclease IV [Fimbriiglobus sp.]